MRVLIATDRSPAADTAIELAASIAWPADTQLRLVAVVEPFEPVLAADWALPVGQDVERQKESNDRAEAVLDHACGVLTSTGVEVSCRIMRGRPASKIVENAHDFAADLIIVGSRGHGTVASMILGSVSAEVTDHAQCPVLVARKGTLTRVELGLDGSGFARAVEEVVSSWPIFEKIPVDVVSVAQIGMPWTAGLALSAYEPPQAEIAETTEAVLSEHRQICEKAAARLRESGRRVSAVVVTGAPAAQLISLADERGADLLVVGTHGRTGMALIFVGSVARNVMLHAGCSVLVVRDASRAASTVAA